MRENMQVDDVSKERCRGQSEIEKDDCCGDSQLSQPERYMYHAIHWEGDELLLQINVYIYYLPVLILLSISLFLY